MKNRFKLTWVQVNFGGQHLVYILNNSLKFDSNTGHHNYNMLDFFIMKEVFHC